MPENEEESQEQEIQDERPRARSANYRTIYVNFTEFGATPWDLHIVLGKVHGINPQSFGVEEEAELIMSPEHAKAFMLALVSNVKAWENAYGAIGLPPQVLDKAIGPNSPYREQLEKAMAEQVQATQEEEEGKRPARKKGK